MNDPNEVLANISIGVLGQAMLDAARAARIGVTLTLVDPPRPRNIYVSDAAADILGWSVEELKARDPMDNVAPQDLARMRDRLDRRAGGELGPVSYELLAVRKDGAKVTVELASSHITVSGRPAVLAFLRDVTERKRLEAQLVQADRLAALGTMAAAAAHEINNPLAYVMLNLEWIARKLPALLEDPTSLNGLMTLLQEAQHGAQRVSTIVRELRSFSRADAETRRPVQLADVVQGAIKMAGHEIRHRARVSTSFEPVRAVWASEARLEQVVVNLLLNAAQAVPEARAEGNEIRVSVREGADRRAVLEVWDNGEGISAEVQTRIFDPFFTTKSIGVGTGLGLSICHGIVTSLGGQISVYSEPGQGTTFRVVLPTTDPHRADLSELAEPPAPARGRRARVLIVDDEPPIARLMRELLSVEHDVVALTGAREALDVARSGQFDVIFCDLMMPGLSGVDFYEQLRAEQPGLERKIVFMTGGAFTTRAAEFLESVENRRIEKPFGVELIERIVQDLMEGYGG